LFKRIKQATGCVLEIHVTAIEIYFRVSEVLKRPTFSNPDKPMTCEHDGIGKLVAEGEMHCTF